MTDHLRRKQNEQNEKRQKYNGKAERVGDVSGSLTIERIEHGPSINNKPGKVTLHCRCKCGRERAVKLYTWRKGAAQSCGQHTQRTSRLLRVVYSVYVEQAKKTPPYIKAAQSMAWVSQPVE